MANLARIRALRPSYMLDGRITEGPGVLISRRGYFARL